MIVVIAEKPSVARDIARVLRCGKREDGAYRGDRYLVTWALGHLVTLCEPDEIDIRYKKWRMEDLPITPETIPTKVIDRTKSQFEAVRRHLCMPGVQSIVCATDAGREGELIFRLIYEKCACQVPVMRLWISSMTDAAILDGFAALKPGAAYDRLYASALCRSQADWLVGMNASRAFSIRHGALLSVGRVQTPTLAILVRREREIRAFVPEMYHTVTADFGDYQGQWFDPDIRDERTNARIRDRERAEKIAAEVRGREGSVTDLRCERKKEAPPLLYDLGSLQRDANRLFGFTAARTLKIAQELYEVRKGITYPRTDSRHLSPDMHGQVSKTLDSLDAQYREAVNGIPAREGRLPLRPRVFDAAKVTDHHAIIPTARAIAPQTLSPDARALYDLVVKRLIAAFYPDHEYEAVRVVTEAAGHPFKSTGRRVLVPGWKAVEGQQADRDETLPSLAVGDRRRLVGAKVKKESTKAPQRHTDASLLNGMEQAGREVEDGALRDLMKGSGIGTPATRAAIIERLIKVGYAQRLGRSIRATDKGERLMDVIPEEIASPETTGRWEQALDRISRGEGDPARFMEGIRRFSAFLVRFALEQEPGAGFVREAPGKAKVARRARQIQGLSCPLCGAPVQENSKAFGCSAWQKGCGFTLWKDALRKAGGPQMEEDLVRALLLEGKAIDKRGTLSLQGEMLSFTPQGADAPGIRIAIRREKPRKTDGKSGGALCKRRQSG